MMQARLLVMVALLSIVSMHVFASDSVAALREFVNVTRSAEGTFNQTVISKSGRRPQKSEGHFAFLRPGKFLWSYDQPYVQTLVGDGVRLWSWDPDLNQVTVKRMGEALGATPAAILFGDDDLERNFILTDQGSEDGFTWVEALPRKSESGFEKLRIALRAGQIARMEMQDSFGQQTVIVFTRFLVNPVLSAARFHFQVPEGADVAGDLEEDSGVRPIR